MPDKGTVTLTLENGQALDVQAVGDTGLFVVPVPADPVQLRFVGASGREWVKPYPE